MCKIKEINVKLMKYTTSFRGKQWAERDGRGMAKKRIRLFCNKRQGGKGFTGKLVGGDGG